MITKQWIKVIIWIVMNSLLIVGCGRSLGNYQPISGVDDRINSMGKAIAQYQREEVWTGGNEYSGAYTWNDLDKFHSQGGVQEIVESARDGEVFKEGVIALKLLPADQRNEILVNWSEPIDPTWSQTGTVGDGTTDAGQQAEYEIATALTSLISDMLKLTDEEIKRGEH